jgi:plasmid stabilization system protein ParE
MSCRVIRSDLALIDLEEQSEYIRQHSPRAALRFLSAAEAIFRQLASMPGMGERYETNNPLFQDLRCFPIPKFPSHYCLLQIFSGCDRRDSRFARSP